MADREDCTVRGSRVIVGTSRGEEIGTVLESVKDSSRNSQDEQHDESDSSFKVLRPASADDETRTRELKSDCEGQFADWQSRIAGWNLDLELIDLEWTLDRSRLILYVLNERGPDCTKLALQAAAAGLGPVEVQPVDSEGLMEAQLHCGCGSGGCGCGY
jgi:cell fate regulator YaaT (PSP1 superfamily)